MQISKPIEVGNDDDASIAYQRNAEMSISHTTGGPKAGEVTIWTEYTDRRTSKRMEQHLVLSPADVDELVRQVLARREEAAQRKGAAA